MQPDDQQQQQETADDDNDAETQSQTERQRERRQEQNRQSSMAGLETINVSNETRAIMRQIILQSDTEYGDIDRKNLVDRFLRGEIRTEQEFRRQLESLETELTSWNAIFTQQREIRRQIQNLMWRVEGYVSITEIAPAAKIRFQELLKRLRSLNTRDDGNSRNQRRLLHRLATPQGNANAAALSEDAARAIFMSCPAPERFEPVLNNYIGQIQTSQGGQNSLRTLRALKSEEYNIEREFERADVEIGQIIAQNLSHVRLLAEERTILETASKACGIRLRPNIQIEFETEGGAYVGSQSPLSIRSVEVERIPIYDNEGRQVDTRNGTPVITLSNGASMTFGRFKKWADSCNAVERAATLSDVEDALELRPYGIRIQRGMSLSWPMRERDEQGNSHVRTTTVTISRIDEENRRIHFNFPVTYQAGPENLTQYEQQNSLSYGEFIKWWYKYEVERSLTLQGLREALLEYNEAENREFRYESKDNPPIIVEKGERLRYPDECNDTFKIKNVDSNGISFDDGDKRSFSQFFHWVKRNHVQKVPPSEETAEEKAQEEATRKIAAEKERKKAAESEEKLTEAQKRSKIIKEETNTRAAGSPLAYLKELWSSTQFLSFQDLLKMGKEVVEYVKRRHERRSKGRYGDVGSRLPGIVGHEFERVKQAASDEEVEKYKSAMEKWGVKKVKHTLWETNDKDIAKAAIMTLVHEGEMRWDDHHIWKTLNRLTSRYTLKGAELFIPEDPKKIPFGHSGEDMAKRAIDALWGIGKGAEWYREGISRFNSRKNDFEYEFKQLENDPKGTGGPLGECRRMLADWKDGKYVDPMRYEQMISGAIKWGKMGTADKMFFIIAGVTARNKNFHYETLLSFDRIGELNSLHNNAYPLIDFFTQELVEDPLCGWDEDNKCWKKRKFNLSDFEKWVREDFPDDFEKNEAGNQFQQFLWEKMLLSDSVKTRISKGTRHAENQDHDDAHLFVPPLTPNEIVETTTASQGNMKKFSTPGYMNAYAGFNQYFVTLSRVIEKEPDEDKRSQRVGSLRDAIFGFIKFDGILHNRFKKKEGDRYARLDETHFNRSTVVDAGACLLKDHRTQLRNLVMDMAEAYGRRDQFRFLWDTQIEPPTGSMSDKDETRKQGAYETKLEELGGAIEDMISEDKGVKAVEIIRRARRKADTDEHGLRGVAGCKQKET